MKFLSTRNSQIVALSDITLLVEYKSVGFFFFNGAIVEKMLRFCVKKLGPKFEKVLNRERNVANQMAP